MFLLRPSLFRLSSSCSRKFSIDLALYQLGKKPKFLASLQISGATTKLVRCFASQNIDKFKQNHINGLNFDEFMAFMKSDDKPSNNIDYRYSSKTIYELIGKYREVNEVSWSKIYFAGTIVWCPISYVTYAFAGFPIVLVPVAGWALTILSTLKAQNALNSIMSKIDLLDDKRIALYRWNDQEREIICEIEEAKIQKIEKSTLKDSSSQDSEAQDAIIIYSTLLQVEPKKEIKAVFKISPEMSNIQNLSLFKNILNGKVLEIQNYKQKLSSNSKKF